MLDAILDWAAAREDIQAVVLTGSRARDDGTVDRFSDYDVELFTTAPERYEGTDWPAEIGQVWVCLPLTTREGQPTRLVFYEGGEKVDFTIVDAADLDAHAAREARLYGKGYRVLLDRAGLSARLQAPPSPPVKPLPGEAEFLAVVTEFWFEAAHIPRYLLRGELWVVKFRDWTMKELLLRMIEWHAITEHGKGHDVWYIGTNLERWTSPGVWERLEEVFGRFDRADSWRALLATVDLFRKLSAEVAERLSFRYPAEMDSAITSYIRSFANEL